MKNIMIMGCGRSGTSLFTSMFIKQGYHGTSMLVNPHACPLVKQGYFEHPEVKAAFPDYSFTGYHGNPNGNFECKQVNYINEIILSDYDRHSQRALKFGHRWIASISPNIKIETSKSIVDQAIRFLVKQHPFCYKDPRFSYTLPVWDLYLSQQDTIYICVFRHPKATVTSMEQECQLPHMSVNLTEADRFKIWTNMYDHILQYNRSQGKILFIHFNQILDGSAAKKISQLFGLFLDTSKIRPGVTRNNKYDQFDDLPEAVSKTYKLLCSQTI